MKNLASLQVNLPQLRQVLLESLDDNELRTLCFDLDVDYDSLKGEGKEAKIRELIAYLDRRGQVRKLLQVGQQQRPNIPWWDLLEEPPKSLLSLPFVSSRSPWLPFLVGSAITMALVGLFWFLIVYPGSPFKSDSTPTPTNTPMSSSTATFSPALVPPPVSLVGMRFLTDDFDPRLVDLRTAASSGIPVSPGQALRLYDLQVHVSRIAPDYTVQAEVYADVNANPIGMTTHQSLTDRMLSLGDVKIESFQHGDYTDAWRVQEDWTDLTLVLVTYYKGEVAGLTHITIRLDPNGTAWLSDPPNLNIASLVYTINNGPPLVVDLRDATQSGLDVGPGDTLTLLEIWYGSNADGRDDETVYTEGFLKTDVLDAAIDGYQATGQYVIKRGIHKLGDFAMSWTIPEDQKFLIVKLVRSDAIILQELRLPLRSPGTSGLVRSSEVVLWPFDRSTFFDFEKTSDFTNWQTDEFLEGDITHSSNYVYSGNQSLRTSFSVTEASPKYAFAGWYPGVFTADALVAHYYLPSEPDIYIEWLQFCATQEAGWTCKFLETTRDRWQTAVFDFTELVQPETEITVNQSDLYSFLLQGRVAAPGATEPVSYSIYLDAIQIFKDDEP